MILVERRPLDHSAATEPRSAPIVAMVWSAGSASSLSPVETALLAWFRASGRDLPWRSTQDPYAILVSEVMLQQTV